jgi:signal peptidase I
MKSLFKICNWVLYAIVVFILVAVIGTFVFKRPFLMSAVRSNSMYPLFQKGDIIFLNPIRSNNNINIGDIIVFKTQGGSYDSQGLIVHRIIGGNPKKGYTTKGDANNYTDQSIGNPSIKPEWVVAKLIVIGVKPLKLPLLGNLSLYMEKFYKMHYAVPVIVLITGLLIALSELLGKEKVKGKRRKLDMQYIYFFSGITISLLFFSSMIASSQHFIINYEVSESKNGVIMGSNVGIVKLGEKIERPLVHLSNTNFIPTFAIITCDDHQITPSQQNFTLKQGESVNTSITVNALKVGKYKSTIHIGIFMPFLPKSIIQYLANSSYWLALIILSLIPGLPIMLYPLINPRLRRRTFKDIRYKFRRTKNKLSFIHY